MVPVRAIARLSPNARVDNHCPCEIAAIHAGEQLFTRHHHV